MRETDLPPLDGLSNGTYNGRKKWPAWPFLLSVLLLPRAQAAHITDKMAVGFYQQEADQTPLRLLTSGTPLERLGRNGNLCKVRLGSKETGWLECRYITDDKPARAMLLEAQAKNGELRHQLHELEQQIAQLKETADRPALPPAETSVQTSLATTEPPGHSPTVGWKFLLLSALGGALMGGISLFLLMRRD